MKNIASRFTTAAVLATGLALGAVAGTDSSAMTVALTCKGELFGGDYLVKPVPTFAPLTAEHFNRAAGEDFVLLVEPVGGSHLRVMPKDAIDVDCEDFMQKMEDTGLIENISPNWLMRHMSPN